MTEQIKTCRTCAHYRRVPLGTGMIFHKCSLHGSGCGYAVQYRHCVQERDWRAIPSRRSLLRWIIDTFFRI